MGTQILQIDIDTSDVKDLLDKMQANMTDQAFINATSGIMRRTGKKVVSILARELPQDYEIKPGQVRAATKKPIPKPMSCTVPVKSERRLLGPRGGNRFAATGGIHGWKAARRKTKSKIKVKVYKGNPGQLPPEMKSYGGQPPFRNLSAPKLNGLAFTRETKNRLPIRPVAGIGIPQMPMNKSKDDVQSEVSKYLLKETEHRYMALMRCGR